MIKFDRRLIKSFDWLTFGIIVTLTIIGIMTIASATRPAIDGADRPDFYLKQIVWLCVSLCAFFIIIAFDYVWLQRFAYIFYGIGLVLLLVVLVAGKTSLGAQRWISIGPLTFQPSEFFRLAFVAGFSAYLTSGVAGGLGRLTWPGVFFFAVLPMALIVKQPDLGTAILLLSLFVVLCLAKGLSRKLIAGVLVLGIIALPFFGHIFWEGLKEYQKNRLVAFLDPDVDPSGIGYQINQSKITIGSGGFAGKGYMQGTQGPLRFLPEKHTDFIFAVFAEEWGFLGSFVLMALYLMLFLRGLDTALKAKDDYGRLVATGITAMFFVYFTVNISMTLGMMPVVGVPLPFVSYGGTALLSNFIAAGILICIRTRRFELFYPHIW
ncbi:MAG TPA: rod shape-determining protein RodA [Dissulfurispiraceae bacterium]|nr:rod shape-determining protein RodA [Dissulfurispiraceae bacterium]